MRVLNVLAEWDEEASVWVVSSDDIPGLITEAETVEEVQKKLRVLIPELMEENGLENSENEPSAIEFTTRRRLDMHVN